MNRRNRRAGIGWAASGTDWWLSVAIGTHRPDTCAQVAPTDRIRL